MNAEPKKRALALDPVAELFESADWWASKHAIQASCRELLESGELSPEDVLLIKPERLRGAKVNWSKSRLA